MSYDLLCFHSAERLTEKQALDRATLILDEDCTGTVEPHPSVAAFVAELIHDNPQPADEDLIEGHDGCPWASEFDQSDGHVHLPVVHSRASEICEHVFRLAKKHRLFCVDLQTETVAVPDDDVAKDATAAKKAKSRPKGPAASFGKVLDELLKPLGFMRKGRLWRKDADQAVLAVQLFNDEGIYEVNLCAWLKAKGGAIDPEEVEPWGACHLARELDDFLDLAQSERLQRAMNFTCDLAEEPPVLGYRDVSKAETETVLRAMELEVPLTIEWRTAVLQQVFSDHALPLLTEIEAGTIAD